MKRCTYCGREHPDEATVCALDRQPLEPVISTADLVTEPPNRPSNKEWVMQVVFPSIAWFLVNFILIGCFSYGAGYLFSLITATWAAIDCSKLQSKGERLLGIPFKPVVVFAMVAFFWWGFTFVWYLVMRLRVKNAPDIPEPESQGSIAKSEG